MVNKMFSYTVSKNADKKMFDKACALIEEKLKFFEKKDILEDVDGSQIQIYNTSNGNIKVLNDYEVDAVYVDSEVNLNHVFSF